MLFHLDTENCEDIKLRFDREDGLENIITDFSFGLSALYTDFCMQLGLDQKQSRALLDVCQSCMMRNVEELISQGVLDLEDEEEDETDGVSKKELDELETGMKAAGFSADEIRNAIALVKDAGSMDAALEVLEKIGEEAGVDWSAFEK